MFKYKTVVLVYLVFSFIPAAFADNSNKALGQVQFSAYVSTNKAERGLFTTDFILPLYYSSDKDTLFYFNPKDTYLNPNANEVHLGAGLRHIFDDSFILGINSFFDRRQDHSGPWFSQAGVGLEYLSHPLDLRLNWYKPTTGAKTIDTTYAFGSTSLIQYDQKEEPLQGLDFEAGVPVFDKYTKTRLYVGGYFYQSRLSKDVNGFRARTETSLTKWLSLDTTFNSNVGKKEEFYGGLRVDLAFDLSNLFGKHGKAFFSAPSNPDSNNTYLEDRIFERVVRDIDIQSSAATTQSNAHDLIYVNNTNEGAQDGTREHPYVAIQNGVNAAAGGKWVFVEGQSASQYAGNIALSSSVVLWGSGYNGGFKGVEVSGTYPVINGGTNGITLANANTVMGLQIQNATNDGIIFTNGTTLTGTVKYSKIISNSDNGIDLSENTSTMADFIISNNSVDNNGNAGITLAFNGFSGSGTMNNFVITNNVLNNNVWNGLDMAYNGEGGSGIMTNFSISNNVATGNGNDGLEIGNNGFVGNGIVSNFTISNNTFTNNSSDGLSLASNGNNGTGRMTGFVISNNTFNGNVNDGIDLSYNGNSGNGTMTNFTISNNSVNSSGLNGIDLSYNANFGAGTMTDLTISNNMANNNVNDGITLSFNGHNNTGTMTNVTISGNTTNNNGHDGIDLSYNGDDGVGHGTMNTFTISHNISNNNTKDGLDLSYNGFGGGNGTMTDFTISNNTVNSNSNDGIDLSFNGNGGTGAMSGFTFFYNTVTGNTNDGIILSNSGGGSMADINFGNTSTGGHNSIYGNNTSSGGYYDIDNSSGINDLPAEYNWWGQAGGPVAGQIGGPNSVDFTHPLSVNPN